MDKFVKRVQSRLTYSGVSATKAECREAYQAVIAKESWENPTDDQLSLVAQHVKNNRHSVPTKTITLAADPISQPQTFNIPVEELPSLSAPEENQPQPSAIAPDSAITQQSAPGALTPESIPQAEVTDIVGQVFKNQPPEVKNQITEYALQHSFDNVRQLQEFLEQLRSMEFNMMVQTLQDHFSRRGSMLTQLNNLIQGQQHKDQGERKDFFDRFQSKLTNFQQEMNQRLSKQSL